MNQEDYMRVAIDEAKEALKINEVPIGAVIVKDGEIIAKAHNRRESSNLTFSHAEVLAIQEANQKLGSWRLDTCEMYVTIEPCPMCAGTIIQSRLKKIVYGASDYKAGSHKSIINLFDKPFNHKVEVVDGVLQDECGQLMSNFFKTLRKNK